MNQTITKHIENVFHHLYINPLEKCNFKCKICYTRKTSPILTEQEIITFIERYEKEIEIKMITFCGGEVFTLPYFTHLINVLTNRSIFIQIITNGSINRLNEITNPNSVNLIVSIDGLEPYHDSNRGKGSFQKCIKFLRDAKINGFHTEIFSIVTKQNLDTIDTFEQYMKNTLEISDITYHPRKPLKYLSKHPLSNIAGHIEGFDFLDNQDLIVLMKTKKTFPPRELGCYQICVSSDGMIYGCCEGYRAIGSIHDPISQIVKQLKQNIGGSCFGCSQPEFMCGIKDIINTKLWIS